MVRNTRVASPSPWRPRSKIRHTDGWVTARASWISRLKRSITSGDHARSGRMVLTAIATPSSRSNAAYTAIDAALEDVREGRTLAVPMYLRDPNSSPVASRANPGDGPGKGYIYSHSVPGAITGQDYLGVEREYYTPGEAGLERAMAARLAEFAPLAIRADKAWARRLTEEHFRATARFCVDAQHASFAAGDARRGMEAFLQKAR